MSKIDELICKWEKLETQAILHDRLATYAREHKEAWSDNPDLEEAYGTVFNLHMTEYNRATASAVLVWEQLVEELKSTIPTYAEMDIQYRAYLEQGGTMTYSQYVATIRENLQHATGIEQDVDKPMDSSEEDSTPF